MKAKQLVAVYGTLRKGGSNHKLLENYNANYKGDMLVKNFVMLSSGAFPAVVPTMEDPTASVWCEVYEVSDVCMQALDGLEGVDHDFYERWEMDTRWGKATIYVWHPMTFHQFLERVGELVPVIAGGHWIRSARPIGFKRERLVQNVDDDYLARIESILATGLDPLDELPKDPTVVHVPEKQQEPVQEAVLMREMVYNVIPEEEEHARVSNPAF